MGDRALAAMSSSAVAKTPTDKAKTDCVAAAHLKYSETSIALYNRQGMAPTIDDIVAKRRLLGPVREQVNRVGRDFVGGRDSLWNREAISFWRD
jgi:hypothetical protein